MAKATKKVTLARAQRLAPPIITMNTPEQSLAPQSSMARLGPPR